MQRWVGGGVGVGWALKMIPLHRVQSVGFLEFAFLFFFTFSCRFSSVVDWHCPGPITWQNAFIKTVELQ